MISGSMINAKIAPNITGSPPKIDFIQNKD
jgi:hypothetical protein